MSGFLQNLRQPEYVHVLINHLPLTGLLAAVAALIGALLIRNRGAILLAMALVSLFSLSAWPVASYGEQGYDRVYSMADREGDSHLARHKELAERWIWLFYVTAAVGAIGFACALKWPKASTAMAAVLLLLAVLSLIASGVIAEEGGKVRHPEFRATQK